MRNSFQSYDRHVGGLLAVNVLSVAYLTLAPGLVGAFVDRWQMTPEQAGLITFAQLAGSALGVSLVLLRVCRIPDAALLRLTVVVMCGADLVCSSLSTAGALIGCRTVAGVAAGVAFAVVNAAAGRLARPTGIFGALLTAQMVFGIAGYLALPGLLELVGMRGLFIVLSVLAISSFPLITDRQTSSVARQNGVTEAREGAESIPVVALASLIILYISNAAVWTYLDRIGVTAGLSEARVAVALAWSMGGGLGGAVLSSLGAARTSPTSAILVGALVMAACTALLSLSHFSAVYMLAAAGFNGTLMYVVPYYFAMFAVGPSGHRNVTAASMAIFVGLALGPLVGSHLLVGGRYGALILCASIGMMCAAALAVIAARAATARAARARTKAEACETEAR
jgi:predicted MFS family arabinose efflux permease